MTSEGVPSLLQPPHFDYRGTTALGYQGLGTLRLTPSCHLIPTAGGCCSGDVNVNLGVFPIFLSFFLLGDEMCGVQEKLQPLRFTV